MANKVSWLERSVRDCSACNLMGGEFALERTRGVGEGSVMVIGEAPGREEAATGSPFVGRSGKTLDVWLDAMGIDDCVVTNIVKHRPPANATPSPSQSVSCLPILRREIREWHPKVIILVGKSALRLIPLSIGTKVKDLLDVSMREQLSYEGIPVLFFPHPSWYIRHGFYLKVPPDLAPILSSYSILIEKY